MTRSWQHRGIASILALAAHVGFSATYAQALGDKSPAPLQDEHWALEIADKKYNEETGKLVVVLRNRDELRVTACAVALVFSDSTGGGSTLVRGEEMYLGDGIAPGAFYEMEVELGPPGPAPPRFSARAVKLYYEIRSDNSSYGDTASIERLFETRAAYFVEFEKALARLREGKGPPALKKSVLPLLREETEKGKKALRALTDQQQDRYTQLDRPRLAAFASISNLTEQTLQRIEAGEPAEQVVSELEWVLEDQLARTAKNIRPADLEGYESRRRRILGT